MLITSGTYRIRTNNYWQETKFDEFSLDHQI